LALISSPFKRKKKKEGAFQRKQAAYRQGTNDSTRQLRKKKKKLKSLRRHVRLPRLKGKDETTLEGTEETGVKPTFGSVRTGPKGGVKEKKVSLGKGRPHSALRKELGKGGRHALGAPDRKRKRGKKCKKKAVTRTFGREKKKVKKTLLAIGKGKRGNKKINRKKQFLALIGLRGGEIQLNCRLARHRLGKEGRDMKEKKEAPPSSGKE